VAYCNFAAFQIIGKLTAVQTLSVTHTNTNGRRLLGHSEREALQQKPIPGPQIQACMCVSCSPDRSLAAVGLTLCRVFS
jgi:hypothetical protein